MKRNEKKVPGFDEIIFENRNQEYGAYDLRKRNKSITSWSLLSALTISITIVLVIFLKSEPGTASAVPEVFVIVKLDDFIPVIPDQPVPRLPAQLEKTPQNIAPEVVADTAAVTTFIPITDDVIRNIRDGDVNDTLIYSETPGELIPVEPKVFIWVEEMPQFPGGEAALLEFIGKNTSYPDEAIQNNIEGRIFLKFVVNPDGSVGKIEILKGVDPLLDKEAIRVVGTLPRFRPGKQNGEAVSVWYSVPVLFKINR